MTLTSVEAYLFEAVTWCRKSARAHSILLDQVRRGLHVYTPAHLVALDALIERGVLEVRMTRPKYGKPEAGIYFTRRYMRAESAAPSGSTVGAIAASLRRA